ncbi:putative methylesterase 11, chloroplastic [Ananas comosus]|uniref:Methylesterase 11, chloroplastic n=1 Tax=Ananas comosus TaxID=4615 RepID=A0A6P5G7V3_ANACO|nr:putative methylesterase 11, chloroplastic [Ananas comosus]
MGAVLSCFSDAPEETKQRRAPRPPPPGRRAHRVNEAAAAAAAAAVVGLGSSERWGRRAGRKERAAEEALIHEQALAAAAALVLQQSGAGIGSAPFDRSASLRYPGQGHKKQPLPRSSSSRPRSLADPVLQPQQLVQQGIKAEDLETNHFVLVHGGGFGAWCWYKTIALLEDGGFKVNAIDLTGSGIHSYDTNKITSLTDYVKPLTTFLETLGDTEKAILVGHDIGGACISYAMEMFPSKVAKAVFLCAAMLTNGQSTLDMFQQQADTNDLLRQAQVFVYSNGKEQPPTAINLDKAFVKDLLFNQSPAKDVSLSLVSMRPIPFAPVLEKLSLTDEKFGSVRRFYIETTEDNAIPLSLQQSMCSSNPAEKVFRLKGSDHSPFFSKPQALHKLLVEIANIPSAQVS